jgi:hypothetical protein
MFYKKCLLILFCLSNVSCAIIGRIPIPGAHITLESLWIRMTERRVVYRPIEYSIPPKLKDIEPYISEISEDGIFFLINSIITSSEYSYKRAPIGKIYFNYSEPFSFHIKLSSLNQDIEKIILKQCFMITEKNEIKDFMTLSRYADSYEPIKTEIIKDESKMTDVIYLNFHSIPINYKSDKEITIIYEFDIYFFEEMKTIKHEIKYIRLFEEYIHDRGNNNYILGDDRIWHEIHENEWDKYNKNTRRQTEL